MTEAVAKPVDDLSAVHFVGVGGAGMSALARVLLARGATVSGSDIKESRALAALRALGARIQVGHREQNIEGARTVVVSTAIPPTNPEAAAARANDVPILQRAQVLALLMRERRGIAISGTHGKTTTTSMIAMVLRHAGLDPTFLIGGDLNETGTNAHHGSGAWLVAEADESDGSLLWLAPEIAVVTNIEADHLDYYRDLTAIRQTFLAFLAGVRFGGAVVACADDEGVRSILPQVGGTTITYGLSAGARWRAEPIERGPGGQRARIFDGDVAVGDLTLAVPGEHNLRNALAAIAVADLAGIPFGVAAEELAQFGGVQRRFQYRGAAAGVAIVDDYAHHPTEVRAALASAREMGWARVIAVFQPHRYSRTAHLGADLGAALATADLAVVLDVYGAGEHPQPGVTGKTVLDGLLDARPGIRAAYLPYRTDVPGYVVAAARPGDLVMTIGAGDVTMLADELLLALIDREAGTRTAAPA
jgi:UDP-N-acetylmuramate--alanine ligase